MECKRGGTIVLVNAYIVCAIYLFSVYVYHIVRVCVCRVDLWGGRICPCHFSTPTSHSPLPTPYPYKTRMGKRKVHPADIERKKEADKRKKIVSCTHLYTCLYSSSSHTVVSLLMCLPTLWMSLSLLS